MLVHARQAPGGSRRASRRRGGGCVSTGGSIAQQLAADHPDVVRRLVLVSTACRLGSTARRWGGGSPRASAAAPRGRRSRCSWRTWCRRGAGSSRRGVAAWLAAPLLARSDLADMATTIEAEDTFDLAHCAPIQAPTLIVAGERDRFYSHALFEETNRLIPASRLVLVPGRGHATVLFDAAYRREAPDFIAA